MPSPEHGGSSWLSGASAWRQVSITFPDWALAESTVADRLAPRLSAAETRGLIGAWFFIRKHPCWRVRYLPTAVAAADFQVGVELYLDELKAGRHISGWVPGVYEAEAHAFGGPGAMAAAHRFFHQESRFLLAYVQDRGEMRARHRRELSLMLCSIMMRAARQDWYEQGDVWARVADHRQVPAEHSPGASGMLREAVGRLISVDAESQVRDGAPLAWAAPWASTYSAAGRDLADLHSAGKLHRGMRDILAHHVIFAWNRLGLPYAAQAVLAAAARTVIFGSDPVAKGQR